MILPSFTNSNALVSGMMQHQRLLIFLTFFMMKVCQKCSYGIIFSTAIIQEQRNSILVDLSLLRRFFKYIHFKVFCLEHAALRYFLSCGSLNCILNLIIIQKEDKQMSVQTLLLLCFKTEVVFKKIKCNVLQRRSYSHIHIINFAWMVMVLSIKNYFVVSLHHP